MSFGHQNDQDLLFHSTVTRKIWICPLAAFSQVVNQVAMSKAVDNLPIPLQHRTKKKENLKLES
jgi:hypothetical protein